MKDSEKERLEKERLERRRKFEESVLYNSTVDMEKMLEFSYNLGSIRRIIKFGIHNFDEQGLIFVEDIVTHRQEKMSGAIFLEELIQYFEDEDEVYAYKLCAKAKKVLDLHREKFK